MNLANVTLCQKATSDVITVDFGTWILEFDGLDFDWGSDTS